MAGVAAMTFTFGLPERAAPCIPSLATMFEQSVNFVALGATING